MSSYREVYQSWQADPEGFWAAAAKEIAWYEPWSRTFDPYSGIYGRWFTGGVTNTAYNCLDRHVEQGRGGVRALVYDSPVTKQKRVYSYAELTEEVASLAAVLKDFGVVKGDRVIIYMPMVPEAAIGMLACARLGAVHSVVFGGFAAQELATRISDAKPKVVLAGSCGVEPNRIVAYKPLLDEAIRLSDHAPDFCLLLQRPEGPGELVTGRDYDWAESVAAAKRNGRRAAPVPVAATDPLYVLYTSGTTAQPKGVVRDTGGHMVALNWSMKNLYNIAPGETFWAASDVGWVVGHSYIVYAPLLAGATTVMYEGKPVGTPDAGAYWRMISEHKISTLFTAPTAFRTIKKEDPKGELIGTYDMSCFRALFLAGERADPETVRWAQEKLRVPVIDHWWQTETGWAICGNPLGLGALPVKAGSPTVPMPGYDLRALDPNGKEVKRGEPGTLAVKLPLPPGALPTLWGSDERFINSYLSEFPGYYSTSDAGYIDQDGYAWVMARTDDVINVAGHRLSTGQMEEVIARHKDVAEAAVIGVADPLKGQLPAAFIVVNSGVNRAPKEIEGEVIQQVRETIGPVAALKTVVTVKRLPKTRSGKILRATLRQMADGETMKVPATIDDPAALEEIKFAMDERGLLKS